MMQLRISLILLLLHLPSMVTAKIAPEDEVDLRSIVAEMNAAREALTSYRLRGREEVVSGGVLQSWTECEIWVSGNERAASFRRSSVAAIPGDWRYAIETPNLLATARGVDKLQLEAAEVYELEGGKGSPRARSRMRIRGVPNHGIHAFQLGDSSDSITDVLDRDSTLWAIEEPDADSHLIRITRRGAGGLLEEYLVDPASGFMVVQQTQYREGGSVNWVKRAEPRKIGRLWIPTRVVMIAGATEISFSVVDFMVGTPDDAFELTGMHLQEGATIAFFDRTDQRTTKTWYQGNAIDSAVAWRLRMENMSKHPASPGTDPVVSDSDPLSVASDASVEPGSGQTQQFKFFLLFLFPLICLVLWFMRRISSRREA